MTVPKPLRERLGIRAGDKLEFTEDRGRLILSKAVERDPVQSVYGILSLSKSTDALLRDLRGEPDAV